MQLTALTELGGQAGDARADIPCLELDAALWFADLSGGARPHGHGHSPIGHGDFIRDGSAAGWLDLFGMKLEPRQRARADEGREGNGLLRDVLGKVQRAVGGVGA